jgi:hypothetical protein
MVFELFEKIPGIFQVWSGKVSDKIPGFQGRMGPLHKDRGL